jgi:predicted permease
MDVNPFLRAFFILVIASMLAVTSWASWHCPLFAVPRDVATHPWFLATLLDAYWGFLTFFVWVAYKQTSWLARASWLVAILLLGNIAMASYCLNELLRTPNDRPLADVLTMRRDGLGGLGLLLAVAGITVITLAVMA